MNWACFKDRESGAEATGAGLPVARRSRTYNSRFPLTQVALQKPQVGAESHCSTPKEAAVAGERKNQEGVHQTRKLPLGGWELDNDR